MAERFGNDLVLLEKIAAGGMAEVHRAKQLGYAGFEKTIAVKRILPNYAQNEEFKAMFRAEANLSGLLAHQNIVQTFGNGEFNDYLYLTMEFVDGKNVRQLLARTDKKKLRIPIEFSLHIVIEAAKGLDYAHNFHDEKTGDPLEIVHRDMSPQNIMLSYDGAVKIVDFGIAKAAARSGQTKAGVLKGKFGYMSPEQAQGLALDRRTDVFALGIILFELLTQRRLFTSDDDLRTLSLVKDCRVPRPSKYNPDITPALDTIVMKALKREKGERYAAAGELYVDLHRYLNERYPQFIPTALSKFLRESFAEDIVEEKKKRDRANAEMPSREELQQQALAAQVAVLPAPSGSLAEMVNDERTQHSESDKTNIDNHLNAKVEAPLKDLDLPDPMQASPVDKSLGASDTANTGITAKTDVEGSISKSDTFKEAPGDGLTLKSDISDEFFAKSPPGNLLLNTASDAHRPEKRRAKRPNVPLNPSRKRTLGPIAMSACLLLVALGAWSLYKTPDSSVDGPRPASEPIALECEAGSTLNSDATACVIEKSDCPAGEFFDVQSQGCIQAASSCLAPMIYDSASKSCREKPTLNESKMFVVDDKYFEPAGMLHLAATPQADEVYINGKLVVNKDLEALKTPIRNIRMRPGTYQIRFKSKFYGIMVEEKATIEADRIVEIDKLMK